MQENQKLFIQRHIQALAHKGLSPDKMIEKSFSILGSEQQTEKAIESFNRSESLIKTLHSMEVVQLEPLLLDAIAEQDKIIKDEKFTLVAMLESNQTVNEIFVLLKTRLTLGLVYALWLSIIATLIFSIMSLKVYPMFNDLFVSLDVELPLITHLALAWHNSILPPVVIGVLFCLFLFFLVFSVRRLSEKQSSKSWLKKIPFIGAVVRFSQTIQWLNQMRILACTGIDITLCEQKLTPQPKALKQYLPDMMTELKAAQAIGSLTTEFEFQTSQLTQQSEKIVTDESRKLVGLVMMFVVSYIVFSIFATYSAIFQTGTLL